MDSKIIGAERSCFRPRGSEDEIKGFRLYLAVAISNSRGAGVRVERVYLSDSKAETLGLDAVELVGHSVQVLYNRWGKLAALTVTD